MSPNTPGAFPSSRYVSPIERPSDQGPSRRRAPPKESDNLDRGYPYANASYNYADLPQAPDPPSHIEMPMPYPSYTQTPQRQFDIKQPAPREPEHNADYAQPTPYEHGQVKANYANPEHFVKYAAPQSPAGPPQTFADYGQQPAFDWRQPQHQNTSQHAKRNMETSARTPASPIADHGRAHPYGGPPTYVAPTSGPPPGQHQTPSYASSPPYDYYHTAGLPATAAGAGRAAPTGPPRGGGRDPNTISPDYAKPKMGYAKPSVFQYAQSDGRISYNYNPQPPAVDESAPKSKKPIFEHAAPAPTPKPAEVKPAAEKSATRPEKAHVVEVHPGGGALQAPPSPGLVPRMHRLSVSAGASGHIEVGAAPPGSPLLEAYRGTYQSMSPMPSPIVLPSAVDDDDLSDLTPLSGLGSSDDDDESSDDDDDDDYKRKRARARARERERVRDMRVVQVKVREKTEEKKPQRSEKKSKSKAEEKAKEKAKKKVKFYDPEQNARDLAETLRHRTVEPDPLIDILPRLNHDQMMQLRDEYKKFAKMQGKGINIAKHLKMKLGSGAFGKACYATALGRWESEAYWANFWYQSNTSRRELLIESLIGRSNAEIREIKAAFSDKRYNDSLEKCMKAELKADKFRVAILLALEERRQEESNYVYGDVVKDDVCRLHDALVARQGGETAMIQTVVLRSNTHMREVLRQYEKTYRRNFAKEMLRKSTNLVVSSPGSTLVSTLFP